jgi:anti-sigma B factor antagonist
MEPTVASEGRLTVVTVHGEIDLEQSSSLRRTLLDAQGKSDALIVDLAAVTMIDSSGVASLLEAFQAARKKGKKMMLAGPGEGVLRVLKLARLDTVFKIAADVEDAKQKLA